MSNRKVFITVMVLSVLLLVLAYTNKEKEINWTPTFNEKETKPLDTKVFFEQLPSLFPNKAIKKIRSTFYETYNDYQLDTLSTRYNYIHISKVNKIDRNSFEKLLTFVSQGNTAFLSARKFPFHILDTLQFRTKTYTTAITRDTVSLSFKNLSDSIQYVNKIINPKTYIKDTILFKKLGYVNTYKHKKRLNFIGIPFQKGTFYIHTNPEVFTNYQILKSENTEYINQLISYLPNTNTYYNKNQKRDKTLGDSPLRYILSQPPLKWAWILTLISLGLFLIFNGKRRQRIVPNIPEVKNTTTEFVKTVSNLYLESGEVNSIVQKEITYFLEDIRSKYLLSTEKLDKNFIEKLASKSNNDIKNTEELISMIVRMRSNHYTTIDPLKNLNKKIEAFYQKNKS
jgi:hypothetical protein